MKVALNTINLNQTIKVRWHVKQRSTCNNTMFNAVNNRDDFLLTSNKLEKKITDMFNAVKQLTNLSAFITG